MPKASIVMITWAPDRYRMHLLKQTLDTYKHNTHCDHELIIVDNGPAEQTEYLKARKIADILLVNPVNEGVAKARNRGAREATGEYIAFCDNDLQFGDHWLTQAMEALEAYPDRKLIACPPKSHPMKFAKHRLDPLGQYQLYARASAMCLVMRMTDWQSIGQWHEINAPGGEFAKRCRRFGYAFIRDPNWKTKHIGKRASYCYRDSLVDGVWVKQGDNTWNRLSKKKKERSHV